MVYTWASDTDVFGFELIINMSLSIFVFLQWKFTFQFILVFSAVGYEPLSAKYSIDIYPVWTEVVGFIILAIPVITIPIFLIYKLCRGQGRLSQVCRGQGNCFIKLQFNNIWKI